MTQSALSMIEALQKKLESNKKSLEDNSRYDSHLESINTKTGLEAQDSIPPLLAATNVSDKNTSDQEKVRRNLLNQFDPLAESMI